MKYSKEKQLGRYKKKTPPGEGSKTEAPVQAALDLYIELKGLDHLRVPDSMWAWIHNPQNRVPVYMKALFSAALAGWPDDMIFFPLTDKYLIACPLEAKSRTGKLKGKKQKRMAKSMNYQIPRSPDDVVEMLNDFLKYAEKLKKIIAEKEQE